MVELVASISIFSPAHTDCFQFLYYFLLSNLSLFHHFTYHPFDLSLFTFPVGLVSHSYTFLINSCYRQHIVCSTSYNKNNEYSPKFQILPGLKLSSFSSSSLNTQLCINSIFSQLGVHLPSMTFFTSPVTTLILLVISPSFSTCQDLFFLPVLLVQHKSHHACNSHVCLSTPHLSPSPQTEVFGIDTDSCQG